MRFLQFKRHSNILRMLSLNQVQIMTIPGRKQAKKNHKKKEVHQAAKLLFNLTLQMFKRLSSRSALIVMLMLCLIKTQRILTNTNWKEAKRKLILNRCQISSLTCAKSIIYQNISKIHLPKMILSVIKHLRIPCPSLSSRSKLECKTFSEIQRSKKSKT